MRKALFFLTLLLNIFTSNISAQQPEQGIRVIEVLSYEDERTYYMDARIESHLPDYLEQAVYSGIPLPLLLQIEVKESNNWWFDRSLVTIEQHYLLHYLPLFGRIKLDNLSDGSSHHHDSLATALRQVGSLHKFPILDKEHFSTQNKIYARIRLKVDVSALPKPLRADSLLGGSWDISSDWKEWVLR